MLLLDARSVRVTDSFGRIGGSDEVWYDARSGRYALAAVANPGGPLVGIIDARRRRWLGNFPSGKDAHSVAGEDGTLFVPIGAGDAACSERLRRDILALKLKWYGDRIQETGRTARDGFASQGNARVPMQRCIEC